jgi:hypothetical protein
MRFDDSHYPDRVERELFDVAEREMAMEEAGVPELCRSFGEWEGKMALREEALAAYEKRRQERELSQAKREEEERQRQEAAFREDVLGFFIKLRLAESRFPEPAATEERLRATGLDFAIEGTTLYWEDLMFRSRCSRSMEGIAIRSDCPECEGTLWSRPIESLADIGAWYRGEHREWHEHYFDEDSTHPNAPKPLVSVAVQARAEPTAGDRLLQALMDFIRERL